MLAPDNHVHTEYSYDTGHAASMERACAHAVEIGVPAVAFTEHVDFTSFAPGDAEIGRLSYGWAERIRPLDVDGYLASVERCRTRFPDLRILTGVEAGEAHLFAGSVRTVLARARFDRVLGSLHSIIHNGQIVPVDERFAYEPAEQVMRTYFAELLRLVEGPLPFEVLAHLDYPRRYWPATAVPYREATFEAEYREVLAALAWSDRVLEVNTRSPLASTAQLTWWRQAGGRAVSFGSDAHVPWRVGDRFDLAMDVAEAAGFGRGRDAFDFWRV